MGVRPRHPPVPQPAATLTDPTAWQAQAALWETCNLWHYNHELQLFLKVKAVLYSTDCTGCSISSPSGIYLISQRGFIFKLCMYHMAQCISWPPPPATSFPLPAAWGKVFEGSRLQVHVSTAMALVLPKNSPPRKFPACLFFRTPPGQMNPHGADGCPRGHPCLEPHCLSSPSLAEVFWTRGRQERRQLLEAWLSSSVTPCGASMLNSVQAAQSSVKRPWVALKLLA